MEIMFKTPNAVVPALVAACSPSVTVSPMTLGHLGALAVASPLAARPSLRQLPWDQSPIMAAAHAGAGIKKSTTSTTSTTSITLAYVNQESTGVKLDGFGGVPPRGIPV